MVIQKVQVDTRIKIDIPINNNRPGIFIYDNEQNKITLTEITNLVFLSSVTV